MIYKVVTYKDGDIKQAKALADKYTDTEIMEKFKNIISIDIVADIKTDDKKENKLYYKVIWGFDDERTIQIDEDSLKKAVFAMISQKKVQFGDTIIDGKYIIAIKEDWNRAMGFNPTYELNNDDWNEIRKLGIQEMYTGKIAEIKQQIQDGIIKAETLKLN